IGPGSPRSRIVVITFLLAELEDVVRNPVARFAVHVHLALLVVGESGYTGIGKQARQRTRLKCAATKAENVDSIAGTVRACDELVPSQDAGLHTTAEQRTCDHREIRAYAVQVDGNSLGISCIAVDQPVGPPDVGLVSLRVLSSVEEHEDVTALRIVAGETG